MFGFNFKKTIKLEELPDKWLLLKSKREKDPLIVRLLENMDSVTEKKEYPIRIGFAVPLKQIDTKTQETLKLLEGDIAAFFEKDSQGKMYAVITQLRDTQYKEFVVQAKGTLDFAKIHDIFRQKFPEIEVQMVAMKDEKWEMYKRMKAEIV